MSLSSEDLAFLRGLQEELNTQPTLGTADPRFWVIMDYEYVPTEEWIYMDAIDFNGQTLDVADFLDCIYGEVLEHDGGDAATRWLEEHHIRLDEDGHSQVSEYSFDFGEVDEIRAEYLEAHPDDSIDFLVRRRFISSNSLFLTLREATEHLKANWYHYDKLAHPYCSCAFRSPQFERLIKVLRTADFSEGVTA